MGKTKRHLIVLGLGFFFFLVGFQKLHAVDLAFHCDASVTSTYIWRGMYNGGLSFQPEASLGFEGEHLYLGVGAWGNTGLSDWRFDFKNSDEAAKSTFVPELDLSIDFSFFGLSAGFIHYYYFNESKFWSWQKINKVCPSDNTSQTEFYVGYDFSEIIDFPLNFTWNTIFAGNDGYPKGDESEIEDLPEDSLNYKRAFSSYLEVNYELELPQDMTLIFQVGLTPWKSQYTFYEGKFSVTNITVQLEKCWTFEHDFYVKVFASGSLNPYKIKKDNVFVKSGGENKLAQRLNGQIGFQFGI